MFAVARTSFLRHVDSFRTVEIGGSERIGLQKLLRCTAKYDLAAETSRSGSHIHDVVGREHHLFVVLDNNDRITHIA